MCLPEKANMYPSVTRPGSELKACDPQSGIVLSLWSVLVLGNENHCGLTVLCSQNRILLSSEQRNIAKLKDVTVSNSDAPCVLRCLLLP